MSKIQKVILGLSIGVFVSAILAWVLFVATGGFIVNSKLGDVVKEDREIEEEFSKVNLKGFGELEIIQGEEVSLSIEANEGFISRIETDVVKDTLVIKESSLNHGFYVSLIGTAPQVNYTLTVLDLDEITLEGLGVISIDTFETESLILNLDGAGSLEANSITATSVEVSLEGLGSLEIDKLIAESLVASLDGAGSCDISGVVITQEVTLAGLGSYDARELESLDAVFELDGAGSGEISVSGSLDANIKGLGSLDYYGDPTVTKDVDGLGSISGHED